MRVVPLLLLLSLAGSAHAEAPALPPRKDGLDGARQRWLAGDALATVEAVGRRTDPAASALLAQAHASLGHWNDALKAAARVTAPHPLDAWLAPRRVTWLRAAGRLREATALAQQLADAGTPGAAYMLADVKHAQSGCASWKAHADALLAEPRSERRHAARRAVLTCTPDLPVRVSTALDMLEDRAPLDALLARQVLVSVAETAAEVSTLNRATRLRMTRRLLAERLSKQAVMVARAVPGPLESGRVEQAILEAVLLGASGDSAARNARLEALVQGKEGRKSADAWKSHLSRFKEDHAASAAAHLEAAAAMKGDATQELEFRHLAGFHLWEAGDVEGALREWNIVAARSHARQKDAQWFVARGLWKQGKHADAARKCQELARAASGNSERASHLLYWSARMEEEAGQKESASTRWKDLCASMPARLHARMACERVGVDPPAAQPSAWDTDVVSAAHALVADARLDDTWRARVVDAAWRHAAGARMHAREALRVDWPPPSSFPADLQLALARLAAALDDANAGVVLAERHRSRVDSLAQPAWLALAFPRVPAVVGAAGQENVDPDLALAIARTESFFASDVRSGAGAGGLMQLMPDTARQLRREGEPALEEGVLFDPPMNARLGSRYLGMLSMDFNGRPELVAAAYNSGPTNARRFYKRGESLPLDAFMETVPYRETRGYIRRVLEAQLNYAALDGRPRHPGAMSPVTAPIGESVAF